MEQTKLQNRDSIQPESETLETRKCHLCEFDKYLSSFFYMVNDQTVESNICLECRKTLHREKIQARRLLKRYSFL